MSIGFSARIVSTPSNASVSSSFSAEVSGNSASVKCVPFEVFYPYPPS